LTIGSGLYTDIQTMAIDPTELQISQASGVPFYRQVQDQLTQLMQSGRLAPGDRLPSMRLLAADLLVSVITTRRAYAELEQAGLIVQRQGRGTFVADDAHERLTRQGEDQAGVGIRDAVQAARRSGLSADEIRTIVENQLTQGRDK